MKVPPPIDHEQHPNIEHVRNTDMKESLASFVRMTDNALVINDIERLYSPRDVPTRTIICGPRLSGKSTLLRGCLNDFKNHDAADAIFLCTGADIALALSIDANDSFFEKLGASPILMVDNIELLLEHEKGDQFIDLMLAERDRLRLDTIFASDRPFDELEFSLCEDRLTGFSVREIAPLDSDGIRRYASQIAESYLADESPTLTDDALEYICFGMGNSLFNIKNALEYLLVHGPYKKPDIITPKMVSAALSLG